MTGATPDVAGGEGDDLDEARVLRFLAARPDFLQRHPSLYMTLAPPARVHGDAVADHMAAMIGAARRQNTQLRTHVVERRVASSLRERVEDAVLGLLRAREPLEWIETELAATLGLDAAHLWLATVEGHGTLSVELGRRLLGGRDVTLRESPSEIARLHGAAAPLVRSDGLVRVARRRGGFALLALGSREPAFFASGSEAPLALLGRAIEAALDRAW